MYQDDVLTPNGGIPGNFMSGREFFRHTSSQNLISDRSPIGGESDSMYETIQSQISGNNGTTETEPLFDAATTPAAAAASAADAGGGGGGAARGGEVTKDVDKLKASNRRLTAVFYLVVVLCVLVVVFYVLAIVCFVIKVEQLKRPKKFPSSSSSSTQWSSSNGVSLPGNCVDFDKVRAFQRIWDPSDDSHFTEDYGRGFTVTKDKKVCFHSLLWLPLFMSKMNAAVNDSVRYIEDQQVKINETVNKYLVNSTGNAKKTTPRRAEPQKAVYAHYFLGNINDQDAGVARPLPWLRENVGESTKSKVDVNSRYGNFTIRHSGFYFLYTHVTFKIHVKESVVFVRRRRNGDDTILLRSTASPASLQGTFKLHENDVLVVITNRTEVLDDNSKSTYFGLYLVRT